MSNVNVIHRHRDMIQLRQLKDEDWCLIDGVLFFYAKGFFYNMEKKEGVPIPPQDSWIEKVDVDIYIKGRG